MKNLILATRVRELRNRRGLSQELLAENSGLGIRTIQRIENGETEPRGDTLRRLASALDSSPDEIIDWTITEDKGFLMALNLSSLGFVLFPLLGILIPLILWISRKGKIKDINYISKEILNFQISWTIIVILTYIYFIGSMYYRLSQAGDISPAVLGNPLVKFAVLGFLYLYNFVLILINTVKIENEKKVKYFPKLNIIK
ncbi:helix-turn-helix domain-containing protein [Cyclobacterium sp. SYSU L10401]|uniref:helix-turn-helix domain-containing protein n=1 Tax=Cyclobacterium sp. SYSU L10401 TaxID=2678657 RepID=UPI0013D23AC7|nr:helix-turn-helix domain-containing protein [Cyclobacterium sp. SYSU L10401]